MPQHTPEPTMPLPAPHADRRPTVTPDPRGGRLIAALTSPGIQLPERARAGRARAASLLIVVGVLTGVPLGPTITPAAAQEAQADPEAGETDQPRGPMVIRQGGEPEADAQPAPGDLQPGMAPIRPEPPDVAPDARPTLVQPDPLGETARPATPIDAADRTDRPRLLAEGRLISRQRGRVIQGPGETMLFVPNADQRLPGEGVLIIHPCQTLARLEAAMLGREGRVEVTLSGRVYVFRDRNYLLPTSFSLQELDRAGAAADRPAERPAAAARPPNTGAGVRPRDRAVPLAPPPDADQADSTSQDAIDIDRLIQELEQERAQAGGVGRDTGESFRPFEDDGSLNRDELASVGLRPEGELVIRRLARLVRDAGGAWALTFDQDNDPGTAEDSPLALLPSLTLESMTEAALRRGDGLSMIVSGRITTYNRRNYLVPTFFQLEPTGELERLQ